MSTHSTERRRFEYLVVVLMLLMVTDGLVSQLLIADGPGWESSSLPRGAIVGGSLCPATVAAAVMAGSILWNTFLTRPKAALLGAASCVLLYTGIIYWNLGFLFFTAHL